MANKYVFLNHALSPDSPTPPAIPDLELSPFLSLEKGDEANVTNIKMVSHIGTHVDAPKHVIAGGLTLSDFQAGEFVFSNPKIIDLALDDCAIVMPEDLLPTVKGNEDGDLLIFRFGYGKIRREEPDRFSTKCPGFGVESAEFLRENFPKMKALGMDVPSVSCIEYLDQTMAAHNVLLGGDGRRFIIIEDMDLDQDLSGLTKVFLAPLMISECDGCPCTIIGLID